jgi:diamine N-acetyltransferase
MISIRKAEQKDSAAITAIGKSAVEKAHRESCAAEILGQYMQTHYNEAAIEKELADSNNIYHLLYYNNEPAGFSKIVLNTAHNNITLPHTTKLDRIYLLEEYFDKKLGCELLQHNVALSKTAQQQGMWLFTWVGNQRAVNFYKKAGFDIVGSHMFHVTAAHANENHHMLLRY